MDNFVQYVSVGAGPPSLALALLNVQRAIPNPTDLILFADTGWEKQATYDALPAFERYFAEFGINMITVSSRDGRLQDYVRDKSVPIPVFTENGMGKRQCTDKWKIRPIEVYLRERFPDRPLMAQLGMTTDEILRVRQPRTKKNRNRFPLIELGMNRSDCEALIRKAGLPVPPWSACLGCPLQDTGRWRRLASEFKDDFDEALEMDDFLRERASRLGKSPVYLHYSKRPLRQIFSSGQSTMFSGDVEDPTGGGCESGYCFT